ncbi:MAG: sulfite exporter TauE/SafE family protein [Chloroflexi bacterium]|nr:sulfite exporter TauE/SafE family protein [Chloroflexota bacterium]
METESVSLVAAFAAGLLSFISPCILPLVPAYIGHLTGSAVSSTSGFSHRRGFFHALAFVCGFSLVFIALGVLVGLAGSLMVAYMPTLRKAAGVVLVLLGLQVTGLFQIPFLLRERRLSHPEIKMGYFHSLLVGITFSLGWTPCVGVILGGILTLAATSGTAAQGAYLLSIYSLGLGIPFLAAGLALGPVARYLKRINRYLRFVSVISGLLLIGVGVLIFTNSLVRLNQYFDFFGLGRGI